MYRTYRTGKFPDLKISHRDILIPLTALTQCSPGFVRCLMSTLINAILHEQKISSNTVGNCPDPGLFFIFLVSQTLRANLTCSRPFSYNIPVSRKFLFWFHSLCIAIKSLTIWCADQDLDIF